MEQEKKKFEIEYIYLLKTREFIRSNEEIYKIGRTSQINLGRFEDYPKYSILYFQSSCLDSKLAEKKIKELFNFKYKKINIGTEYFEGEFFVMRNDIINIINEVDYQILIKNNGNYNLNINSEILKDIERNNKDLEKNENLEKNEDLENNFINEDINNENIINKINNNLKIEDKYNYYKIKENFELKNFKIKNPLCYATIDNKGELIYFNKNKFKENNEDIIIKEYKKNKNEIKTLLFIDKWLDDPEKKTYEGIEFNTLNNTENYYNLYDCLKIEKNNTDDFNEELLYDEDYIFLIDYLKNIFGEKTYNYIIGYFAYMLKFKTKLNLSLLFNTDKFGVNEFLNWFGEHILGNKNYININKVENIVKNKLLVILTNKDNDNIKKIISIIDSNELKIENKKIEYNIKNNLTLFIIDKNIEKYEDYENKFKVIKTLEETNNLSNKEYNIKIKELIYINDNKNYNFEKSNKVANIFYKMLLDYNLNNFDINQKILIEKKDEIQLQIKDWFFNNYEITKDKYELINGKKKIIFVEIFNKDINDNTIYFNFINSETYKNLLSEKDKIKFSNHLFFTKYIANIKEIKNNYYEDKWMRIDKERIHLRNVIISLKEKINNIQNIFKKIDIINDENKSYLIENDIENNNKNNKNIIQLIDKIKDKYEITENYNDSIICSEIYNLFYNIKKNEINEELFKNNIIKKKSTRGDNINKWCFYGIKLKEVIENSN